MEDYADYQIPRQEILTPKIRDEFNRIKSEIDNSVKNFQRRNRVKNSTIILMLSVAGLYDLTQFGLDFIPFIGWILSFFVGLASWLTFYIWTSIEGWGFSDTVKKWGVYAMQTLGIIPVINIGPEITAGVILTILIVKSDDFVYNKTKGRVDAEKIKQGLEFFKLFREV